MSGKKVLDQCSAVIHSESAQRYGDSDEEPMVYEYYMDYATSALQNRDNLIAEGVDPDSIIFQSDLRNRILRREGESPAEFAKRYVETVNAMIQRGITILNDQCTTQVMASGFRTADRRVFDLGPESGATKGEFREFSQWFSEISKARQVHQVPEKWFKFGKLAKGRLES